MPPLLIMVQTGTPAETLPSALWMPPPIQCAYCDGEWHHMLECKKLKADMLEFEMIMKVDPVSPQGSNLPCSSVDRNATRRYKMCMPADAISVVCKQSVYPG